MSVSASVSCLHTCLDPDWQRETSQPGHGLQWNPDYSERPARGRWCLCLHRLQHVCYGRGQCEPLRARFVILGITFHRLSSPVFPRSALAPVVTHPKFKPLPHPFPAHAPACNGACFLFSLAAFTIMLWANSVISLQF